ncbi:SGNH/GDSL hydrolase family protein [Actinoplanes utahensis]|uniref:SGNH/GDSL hydrolase family protein n=1 Tax=Actinoplanes utahensis TaxID=1869 RepID=UPI0013790C70|nr:SGNH/GDSL hydrolase family protein [Actinoplanes utahensis]
MSFDKRGRRPARSLVALVAMTLLANLLVLVHGSAAQAAAPKLMVVGDSISQGIEGDYTWRYRLATHLSGTGADFVGPWTGTTKVPAEFDGGGSHTGAYRPGISFDSANLAQWGWQMHQAKDVVGGHVSTYQPDYLLVELGFNDLGWGVNEPAGLLNDFEWFVYHARAAKPDVRILVANVLHRTPLEVHPDLPQKITNYNAMLAARVPQLSSDISPIRVVDIDSPFDENRDAYDGLHPNIRGEYVIANAFAATLNSSFGLGGAPAPIPTSLPAPLKPGAPTSITAVPVGDKIKVSWSHVFGATDYEFWQRDATAGAPFTKGIYNIGADSWTADLLPAGHTMQFYVRTRRGDSHTSGASATATATVRALTAPRFWVTTNPAEPYTVTVHWDAVAGADDYNVYGASGCGSVPPAISSYTLQQFMLGGKTSWTQEFIFEPCKNYFVTASRYGGETPKPAAGVRAWL